MRIALVSNTSWYLENFRGDTIRALVRDGWDVFAAAPDDEYRPGIESLGARFAVWNAPRGGMSPARDLSALFGLVSLYRRLRPDVVHHFTIKPVILGGIAARVVRIRGIVQSVTGLGYAFDSSNLLRRPALLGYRFALGGRALTIFQNEEDMDFMISAGAARAERCVLIRGSGVDCDGFAELPLPPSGEAVTFLMACRMLWAKGVREFVEAADIVVKKRPGSRFVLLGEPDTGTPDAVPRPWLKRAAKRPHIAWHGFAGDIRPYLAEAHVVVLPSYGEGLPKTLLEGAAAARPLIAADARGSRDVVIHGKTGLLVPPRDPLSLARAMSELADDADRRRLLGRNAQALVGERFSSDLIVEQTLSVYARAISEHARREAGRRRRREGV